MRYAPRVLLAAGLGFAVSFLVACGGGSNLLSGGNASTLNDQLDKLSAAVSGGDCGGASQAAVSFSDYVSNLPSKVSPILRANLLQGVRTVNNLAQQDCQTTSTAPTKSTTTTPSTTASSTTTTPSSTASTTTVSTTTPSTTSTTPATSSTTPSTTSTTPTTGGAGIGGGGPPTGGPGPGNGNGSGGGAPGQQ